MSVLLHHRLGIMVRIGYCLNILGREMYNKFGEEEFREDNYANNLKTIVGSGWKDVPIPKSCPEDCLLVSEPVLLFRGKAKNMWKKYSLHVSDGIMYLTKDNEEKTMKTAQYIGYIRSQDTNDRMKVDSSENLGFFEYFNGPCSFCVFTPTTIYYLKTLDPDRNELIVRKVSEHLKGLFGEEEWSNKESAQKQLIPILEQQMLHQLRDQEDIVDTLDTFGFVRKESICDGNVKSGVLGMASDKGVDNFYFVLNDGLLYRFKDSIATTPIDFVTLSFATVEFNRSLIKSGLYEIILKTPMRLVRLRCKHEVAMSSWLALLSRTIQESSGLNDDVADIVVLEKEILRDIKSCQMTMISFVQNSESFKVFREYLSSMNEEIVLDCFAEIHKLSNVNKLPKSEECSDVVNKFIKEGAECHIDCIPQSVASHLTNMEDISPSDFDQVFGILQTKLETYFMQFKKHSLFSKYLESLLEPPRDPLHLEENEILSIRIADQDKKPRSFALRKKNKSCTIGRDFSNDIVLHNDKVSRHHAVIEYTRTECRILDLGSTHGVSVNQEDVSDCFLKIGDEIRIGKAVLTLGVETVRDWKNGILSLLKRK